MDVVLILRVTALAVILIRIQTDVTKSDRIQIAVPRAVATHPRAVRQQVAEVEGTTVALLEAILILIAELQVGLWEDGLAISQSGAIVPVLGRR